MELSKRMQAIADMVSPNLRVCDVGCDHAYIPIYLLQQGIAPSALACDVKKGPLQIAEGNIRQHGLLGQINVRLSDGLSEVASSEADCVIIAGMGGKLEIQILTQSLDKVKTMQELILQPQSEHEFVRAFLRANNLQILQENMVEEDGKYYQIMRVAYSDAAQNQTLPVSQETVDLFGPCLLMDKNPVLVRFLHYKKKIALQILEQMEREDAADADRKRMEENLDRINEALSYVES
ncbi:MAG: class I SAM-dependent methyltransferase [Lachnospiraceae bacterium]|nr:class I SAM-dependent methyltransferase [Lachnospiraceae bacterium]